MNPPATGQAGETKGTYAQFQQTSWTVVMAAQTTSVAASEALARLCRTYWYPIYAFVRRGGHAPIDASDLTQGFFLHLLQHQLVKKAEVQKGRFRNFLLASLTHYLKDEWRKAVAVKLGMTRQTLELKLSRFRDAFGECIRGVIAPTVDDPAEIEDEIRYLMAAWAGFLEQK